MKEFPKIPGYKIIKVLGEGGMAIVYLGVQENLDRKVAIKVLNTLLLRNEGVAKRFIKEAHTAAKLHHPNIVVIYDVGEANGTFYIVSEYLPGGTLRDIIRTRKKIPPEQAFDIILKIADALDYAHSKGFIHRDVKPENIMFREDGTPVLVDFGIAKAIGASTKLTKTGITVGTPHYMSPEQARGKSLDGRSDMYSLGVVLYEMLTGKVPYDAEDSVAIAIKHLQDPVPRLPSEISYCQPIIDKMMAKDPRERPQNRIELERLIQSSVPGISQGSQIESEGNIKTPIPSSPIANRSNINKNILIGALTILLVALIGSLFYITNFHAKEHKVNTTEERGFQEIPAPTGGATTLPSPSAEIHPNESLKVSSTLPESSTSLRETVKTVMTDDDFWNTIKDSGNIALFKEYLKRFPEGNHVDEAIIQIEQLYWDSVSKVNSKSAYENYLKLYPSGKHATTAKKRLIEMQKRPQIASYEEKLWDEIKNSNSIKKYRQYIAKYPNGKYVTEARSKLEDLIWQKSLNENSIKSFKDYLKEFPNGKYKNIALEKIRFLQKYSTLYNTYKKDPIFVKGLAKAKRYYINPQGYFEAEFFNNTIMIYIPPGEFDMGSPIGSGDPDEHPLHKVRLSGFWISKYEITFDQFDRFCDETGRKKPDDEGWGRGNRPVINVTWLDAAEYCKWMRRKTKLPFNLPTEAQWEKAARGGTEYLFFWGNDADLTCKYANVADKTIKKEYPTKKIVTCNDGFVYTAPVGTFMSNPYGVKDILGNVWEWVRDWYEKAYYIRSPYKDPLGPSTGKYKVLRGGAWNSGSRQIRCANRGKWDPYGKYNNLGFRVVISKGFIPKLRTYTPNLGSLYKRGEASKTKITLNSKKHKENTKKSTGTEKEKVGFSTKIKKIYDISEVDVKPNLIFSKKPEYPNSLIKYGIGGSVYLNILINENGGVDSVSVIDASNPEFIEPAILVIKAYRYTPALKNGKPVKVWKHETIKFTPIGDNKERELTTSKSEKVYKYYEVDVKPKVLLKIRPNYPPEAQNRNLEGQVYVEALVNESGTVDSVILIRASSPIFVKPAINAAKKYLFTPAKIGSRKVKVWVPIAIFFNPNEPEKSLSMPKDTVFEYFAVEKKPKVLKISHPIFPKSAKSNIKSGKVFVKVLVNEEGKVDSVVVLKATNNIFVDSAVKAAKEYIFQPGKNKGKNVKVWVPVTIFFNR